MGGGGGAVGAGCIEECDLLLSCVMRRQHGQKFNKVFICIPTYTYLYI